MKKKDGKRARKRKHYPTLSNGGRRFDIMAAGKEKEGKEDRAV